ncbi:fatty acid hydroxylase [Diaporthe sp. PMI_573]|nr:fatty acid hydroxylase [Diaporthaceae sp. PMI_573]
MAVPTEIGGPPGLPFVGNIFDLQDEVPLRAIERIADIHGPIFKVKAPGRESIMVSGFDLFDELCDETRFYKLLGGKLASAADSSGKPRGLFTQKSEKEDDWGQAHRILMPAFGPLAVAEMFDEMHDIASQLVLKWARQGPTHKIQASEDFSRLTLDTIALCAMDFRFNSFYQEDMHPFVKAMNTTLGAANSSGQLAGLITRLFPSYNEEVKQSVKFMENTSQELVQYRRDHPTEKKDLLNSLINGKDPKTGKTMRDELIAANMQTFLIAGHETTSGLLSFAFLQLLKNPNAYFAARAEVDRVLGNSKLEPKHVNELKYINAVLRETLRLTPTAPAFSRAIRPENTEETVYIGAKDPDSKHKYEIPRGKSIVCLIGKIMQDPKVFGEDAEEFKPERMLDENFEKLPKNAWKPFGTGMRACIGRAFAWQEAVLAVALILQNFDMRLDDPNYEMKVVQTLTLKPKDFYMRASLREGITPTILLQRLSGDRATGGQHKDSVPKGVENVTTGDYALSILYGSNTGTCQALSQKLAGQCAQRGLAANVQTLDAAMGQIPKDKPTVIITASYEGLPTDDAARFVAWLESLRQDREEKKLEGVKYAVFGCGHSDWASTFQKVPTLVDEILPILGAEKLADRGSSDVSKQDTFGDFETWTSGKLWPALGPYVTSSEDSSTFSTIPTIEIELTAEERAAHLQQNVQWANVIDAKVLTAEGEPEKRHIEIELPSNMTYSAGDYLAVLPLNPKEYVRRVMNHFNLPWDGMITIKAGSTTSLPTGKPIAIFDLLQGYVEISQPATKQDIEVLVSVCSSPDVKETLTSYLSPETFTSEVIEKRITMLDLLTRHKADIPLPLATFLSLLPPMRTRHYSISSSPLALPNSVTLTYAVLDAPAWYQPNGGRSHPAAAGGRKKDDQEQQQSRFLGVAGSYMRSLSPGDRVLVSVRSTNRYFRLPLDMTATPVVMMCNGSGIAPFRGFVQERATLIAEGGKQLAPAVLFAGCRRPARDQLYKEELEAWAALGAVDVRWVFSQHQEEGEKEEERCRYVQERMLRDREDIDRLWLEGARFYICGSKSLAKGIGAVARKLIAAGAKRNGKDYTPEEVNDFVKRMRNERFVTDIF